MLETIREYGLERLAESGDEPAIRSAHADYFVTLAERLGADLHRPNPSPSRRRLEEEIGNFRGALDWLRGQGAVEPALRLAVALEWTWADVRSMREGQNWLDELLAVPNAPIPPTLRARVLLDSAEYSNRMGDYERSRPQIEEALAIFRAVDDRHGVTRALRGLGNVELGLQAYDRAEPPLLEAEALARREGDLYGLRGTLNLLGVVARARGEPERSVRCHREARELARAAGHEGDAMTAGIGAAFAALELNELAEARAACLEALDYGQQHRDLFVIVRCLVLGGAIAGATGETVRSVRLLARAVALEQERGTRWPPPIRATCEQWLEAGRTALGDGPCADARAAGAVLPLDQAIDETRSFLVESNASEQSSLRQSAGLTPRELDVLRLLVEGCSDKEIATALRMSRRTASSHVGEILRKLDVPSRTAAATYATRHDLI